MTSRVIVNEDNLRKYMPHLFAAPQQCKVEVPTGQGPKSKKILVTLTVKDIIALKPKPKDVRQYYRCKIEDIMRKKDEQEDKELDELEKY